MKDFSFGFRDLLMYLVPGFLTIVSLLFLINPDNYTVYFLNWTNEALITSFILAISFLVGFFVSTFIKNPINKYFFTEDVNYFDPFFYLIYVFRFIIKVQYFHKKNQTKERKIEEKDETLFKDYKLKNIMKISDLDFKEEIMTNLINKIKVEFNLKNFDNYLNSGQIFYFCARFVDNYSNKEGFKQANREFDLSNFLLSTSIPILLFEFVIIQQFINCFYLEIVLSIIMPIITIIFILNRYIKHRNAWIRNIYRLFYITNRQQNAKIDNQ